jgi:iron(III) transport system substrate-binding protein
MFADTSMEFPVNPKAEINAIVRSWGPFKQDDVNVAAAGEFQAAATRLADRAGYK